MTDKLTREPLATGAIPSSIDIRDYRLASVASEFPAYFELDTVPVKNQGAMPTCTAHASSEIVEYFNMKQQDGYREFSTDYIFGRRESGVDGKGMSLRDALKVLYNYGDVPVEDAPCNQQYSAARKYIVDKGMEELDKKAKPNRITGYYKCKGVEEIKTALMNHGYVLINMPTYKYRIINDVYTPMSENISGYHAVIIYGWDDDKGWLVQNSWGALWAKDGRFILPFDYPLVEAWGVSDDLVNSDIKKPNVLVRAISTICNFVMNYLNKLKK